MKREDLKKLELSDETIDAVMKLHGVDIESHKSKVEADKATIDGLTIQLGEANKAIDGFKALDIDGVKTAAAEWEKKAKDFEAQVKQAANDADAKVAALKFDYALDTALTEAKARNPKAVKALLDSVALKMGEDGKIAGLQEQLEKVKADNDFLFSDADVTPKIVTGGNNQSVLKDPFASAVFKGAGLQTDNSKG